MTGREGERERERERGRERGQKQRVKCMASWQFSPSWQFRPAHVGLVLYTSS